MTRALEDYLAQLEVRCYSQARLYHVRRSVEMLMIYMREAYQLADWRAVSEKHLRSFAVYAAQRYCTSKGERVSANTLRQWLSCIRRFFGWMRESGRLVCDPAHGLELPRKAETLPRVLRAVFDRVYPFTALDLTKIRLISKRKGLNPNAYRSSESDCARLIEMADITTALGLRDRALMEMLYATGIRRAEAAKLDLYDVDTARGALIVREGKGKRDRVVPLTETAAHWLRRYVSEARPELALAKKAGRGKKKKSTKALAPTPALWMSREGKRLSKMQIWERISDYAKQAEIEASVHTFRHSCATHLLRGGASLRHVKQLLEAV